MNEEKQVRLLTDVHLELSDEKLRLDWIQTRLNEKDVDWFDLLELSVVCLNRFVRDNFTGPPSESDAQVLKSVAQALNSDAQVLKSDAQAGYSADSQEAIDELKNKFKREFTVDGGMTPYEGTRSVQYLSIAKWILLDSDRQLSISERYPSVDVWAVRCLFLWQKLLRCKSNDIKTRILERCAKVESFVDSLSENEWKRTKSLLLVELSYVYLFFYEYSLAEAAISKAAIICDLSVQLTGILGKKTKFQVSDVAQLVVNVETTKNEEEIRHEHEESTEDVHLLPVDCKLDDDTLLDQVKLTSSIEQVESSSTDVIQKCVLLAMHKYALHSKARDSLSPEESRAYLDRMLNGGGREAGRCWALQTSALVARSRDETNDRRRIERALRQLDELAQAFRRPNNVPAEIRLKRVFACDPVPIWNVEKLMAEVLIRLGVTREALDLYLRLNMYPECVECYRKLGMLDRAEALIRERLSVEQTPEMLVLLGDITLNEEYFHKAWSISGQRYAEAQKRLAFLYFNRKLFDKALDAFRLATNLQPLQIDSWFTMGYCASKLDRHDVAAECYHRCVTLEADNFEAWNNLASAYVNLGQKERAFQIVRESTKWSFENWKVWDNFVLLATETGHLDDAVRGLHRLSDLKEKYFDINVLSKLVDEATSNEERNEENEEQMRNNNVRNELRKYFGRLTASVPDDAQVWRLYAELTKPDVADDRAEEWEVHANMLRKCFQRAFQKVGWHKQVDTCRCVLMYVTLLTEAQLKLCSLLIGQEEKVEQIKASTRMSLNSVVAVVGKFYGRNDENGQLLCDELSSEYENVVNKLEQVSSK